LVDQDLELDLSFSQNLNDLYDEEIFYPDATLPYMLPEEQTQLHLDVNDSDPGTTDSDPGIDSFPGHTRISRSGRNVKLVPVLFMFGVRLGSLPLILVAGSYGGCVH
jgi:hypothetical protein